MKELDREYTAEFGHFDRESWLELMNSFQDANLYQTSSYDIVRYKRQAVVQMIMRRGNTVVAAAQARIVRLPGIGAGMAYLMWGPMWRPKGAPEDSEVFRQAIRALRKEFSSRRGLVLRLYPLAYNCGDEGLREIFFEEGYRVQDSANPHRTLIIDLKPSLQELRSGLDQKWRNCLNRAEKNNPEVTMGEEDRLFEDFIGIYQEMASRKALEELSDINHLRTVQRDLPPALKLQVVLSRVNGELCAGAIFSAIGNTGVYLSGATSNAGMKTNGSYAIQWAYVKWLKENGFSQYDLNGINPDVNPGTYHFKRGLAGKLGRDVEFLGKFQVSESFLSDLVVKGGEWLMPRYRRLFRPERSSNSDRNKGF